MVVLMCWYEVVQTDLYHAVLSRRGRLYRAGRREPERQPGPEAHPALPPPRVCGLPVQSLSVQRARVSGTPLPLVPYPAYS